MNWDGVTQLIESRKLLKTRLQIKYNNKLWLLVSFVAHYSASKKEMPAPWARCAWFEFAKGRDGWQDTALLCSLKHAHCAIFQHLHPTRHTETATHPRKGNRRCSDPPTRKWPRSRQRSHRRGTKVEKEEAHTAMLRNIVSVVPLWVSSATLKQLLHSTCHCGPPLQWAHTC